MDNLGNKKPRYMEAPVMKHGDPIGGFLNGQWFAESQSLAQFRGGTKYKVKA